MRNSTKLLSLFTVILLMSAWLALKTAQALNPTFYAQNVSASAPPNATGLDALEDTSTSILLFWTSGGGTTASYRIAYASGTTAPATCLTGTQVAEATVGSATNYTITGLTASTTYSFRVCAANASSAYASGVTVTLKTSASQLVFRSMGYNQTTSKASGASNAMVISSGIATFATALANTIGVGDAIQYSSANNATIDRIAFIHGRLSSTKYLVKTSAGATPANLTSNTSWTLFRAYTNFNNVLAGSENSGINATVKNFDTWSSSTVNLATLGITLMVEAYADAVHAGTFTNIPNTWVGSANNKTVFTTPYEARHVGVRQRHQGAWSTSFFYATVTDNTVIELDASNIVVEGMQFQMTLTGIQDWISAVMVGCAVVAPTSSVVEVNQNIFVNINSSSAARDVAGFYINMPGSASKVYLTNNVFICVPGAGAALSKECMRGIAAHYTNNENVSWTLYSYNNTFVGSWYYGIDAVQGGTGTKTIYAKNNIVQGTYYEAYLATTWGAGSGYNLSHNGVATGMTGDRINSTVSFVNAASKDYHLATGDTAAKNLGTNLSADANYPISFDIDTVARTGTWDIGADEY